MTPSAHTFAQQEAARGGVQASIGTGGVRRYERGKWGVVRVNASNSGDESAEATVSVFLEDDSRTQYVRKLWVPRDATRQTWLPVLAPANIPREQSKLHASALQLVESEGLEVIKRRDGEPLVAASLLSLDETQLHLAMVFAKQTPFTKELQKRQFDEAYETVIEVRAMHAESRIVTSLASEFLPPYPEAYQALDQLVICNDQIANDSGGLAALRSWIARGGRAWIMLDLVGMEAARALLGNAGSFDIVDRVELNDFSIETPGSAVVGANPIETWAAEEPVELVRVVTDSANIYSSINDWPAAFEVPFGNGMVVVTTLSARGWRYQHDLFAEPSAEGRPTSGPTGALRYLASQFNQSSTTTTIVRNDDLRPLLSAQLGYRVPSRGIAALILGLNCILIGVAGVWLAKRQQLERLAIVIPLTTLVSGATLIAVGSSNTSSIPAASANFRLANISSEANSVHTDSYLAFYSPDTVELPLEADLAGVVAPAIEDLAGVAKRAVWNDDGHATWERIEVASGSVRYANGAENRTLQSPIRASAVFGVNGLQGKIVGNDQVGAVADAIVAAPPAPYSGVRINSAGDFAVGPTDVLAQNEFLRGTMLSDEQQRRQAIYRMTLEPQEGRVYPQRPTLFVWGDSQSFGLSAPSLFRDSGATLFAIPLEIRRTLPKQRFTIPSTFIRITSQASSYGTSAVFNPRTGRWMPDVTSSTNSFFQFLLPRSVLPCRVTSAEIALKIHAPSRTVELAGLKEQMPVVIKTLESPSGVLTFAIDDPKLLQLDSDGGLRFGVTVSPTKTQREKAARVAQFGSESKSDDDKDNFDNSTWQIDYLRLRPSGETF